MDNYELFLIKTEDAGNFLIKDVLPDGNCGFRSVALNLNLYNLNLIKQFENKTFNKINDFKIRYKRFNKEKQWEGWDYKGKEIAHATNIIRKTTIDYMIKKWDQPINDELLNPEMYESLGLFTLDYHDIKTKKSYYEEYIDNKNENAWIGSPELYALSDILGVTIEIYGLLRYFKNTETTKLVKLYKNGKVPINTRIILIQVIGSKYNNLKRKISILYENDQKGLNHYLFIKKKPL